MDFSRVKIITTVPIENADALRQALGDAGGGVVGEYSHCSFSVRGIGRFVPSANAKPHIGEANKPEVVQEEQIEVTCRRAEARQVIEALRKAHPYEEPIVEVVPLLDETDL